jgi:hypothetical protein
VDRLPWREAYDQVFSGDLLPWAVIVAASLAFARTWRRWRVALAVALPVVYVFLVSVMAERGENMRFKFFLEPTFYVLVASQAYWTGCRLWALVWPPIRTRLGFLRRMFGT